MNQTVAYRIGSILGKIQQEFGARLPFFKGMLPGGIKQWRIWVLIICLKGDCRGMVGVMLPKVAGKLMFEFLI